MTTTEYRGAYDGTAPSDWTIVRDHLADGNAAQVKSLPWLRDARSTLIAERDAAFASMTEIRDSANGRDLTGNQTRNYKAAEQKLTEIVPILDGVDSEIADRNLRGAGFGPAAAGIPSQAAGFRSSSAETRGSGPQPLGETRMADYVRSRNLVPAEHEGLSMRKFLRGAVLGDWSGADAERRSLAEGTTASGGVMVPIGLAAEVIDKARNAAQVIKAGATIVPMDTQTLTYPRLVTDPTASWHTENATISPSDPTFEAAVLSAKTIAGICLLSRELLEDAPTADSEITRILGVQFGLALDKAALYGSGTAPEPRGVKNTTGVTIQSMGTNGATPTNYNLFVDALGTLADNNFDPTDPNVATIYSPRTWRTLTKLTDTLGQPLRKPDIVANLPMLQTNQVGTTYTQGTASNASDAFVGDWDELIIGMRTTLQIQVLSERYADTGTIGLLGWMRADVLVARPKGFVVVEGILP